jgi:hypothetical protein
LFHHLLLIIGIETRIAREINMTSMVLSIR